MSKKNAPYGVLVYDRFFKDKPKAALLLLKKTLWCSALAFVGLMSLLTGYALPLNNVQLAAVGALSAAVFSLVFALVKRRIALPITAIACVWAVFACSEETLERLKCFADVIMLSAKGRFFSPEGILFHDIETLAQCGTDFFDAAKIGFVLLCAFYGLICAAAFARKPRFAPCFFALALMLAPLFAAEKFEFNIWCVPFVALSAGVWAVGLCFRAGLVPEQGGSSDYHSAAAYEEREFRKGLKRADYPKRLRMSAVYYSKYFSVGMYCAALFALSGIVSASVFGKGSSLDYSAVYEFVTGFGGDAGISSSPFENGSLSDYFTDRHSQQNSRLNVTTPSRGEEEIIRVTLSGDSPVYLRGDIGIDFNGAAWTSPVNNRLSGLDDDYRPCEARVIHSILWTDGYSAANAVNISDVTIDYLCSSSVVFLPAYTTEFSYYDNENFDVYGDYVVRVSEDYDNVNTVQCTALVPAYNCDEGGADGLALLETVLTSFDEHGITPNLIYKTVVPEMESGDILRKYADSVSYNYLSVPSDMSQQLDEFLEKSGLYGELDAALSEIDGWSDSSKSALQRYKAAQIICDYLRENYTYSLNVDNSQSNAVLTFLNETKSGHCSLYASALTLLLRQCYIPARYCTGFVADPANGDRQTLYAKNLHAWTEVYLDQYGWVTFDPTSSSLTPSPQPAVTQTTSAAASTPPQTTSAASTTAVLDEPHNTPKENRINTALVVGIACGTAGVIFVAAVVGYYLFDQKKRAYRALENLGRGEAGESSRQIYRTLTSMFMLYGLTPAKGELPSAFFERCGKRFDVPLADKTVLLERAAFDGEDSDEERRDALYDVLRGLYEAAENNSNIFMKIRLRGLLLKK